LMPRYWAIIGVTFSDVARAAAALISVGTVVISVVFGRAGRMAAPGPSFYSHWMGRGCRSGIARPAFS
jgi:hypothetical protein